jgi:hypothetical protein
VPGPFPYLVDDLENPAPGCSVILSYDAHEKSWLAILDSGADYTSIPIDIVSEFALDQLGEVEVLGATGSAPDGAPEIQGLYLVNIEFPEFPTFTVAAHLVLGGTGPAARDFVLIGRDILNRHRILLSGPENQFTVDEDFR